MDTPRRPVGPREDDRGRNEANGKPRQNEHDGSFPQVDTPHCFSLHDASPGSTTRANRYATSDCRNGVTSRTKVSISTSWRSDSESKISPTRRGSASMLQISRATRLKPK